MTRTNRGSACRSRPRRGDWGHRAREQRAARVQRGDERLLAALAPSIGVALENARLFDETKRLLADTNERAAELTVINEIG